MVSKILKTEDNPASIPEHFDAEDIPASTTERTDHIQQNQNLLLSLVEKIISQQEDIHSKFEDMKVNMGSELKETKTELKEMKAKMLSESNEIRNLIKKIKIP